MPEESDRAIVVNEAAQENAKAFHDKCENGATINLIN
jgi:hypothetical protein